MSIATITLPTTAADQLELKNRHINTIIGAAGTGKTHQLIHIEKCLVANNIKYYICAFTNRAVKVLRTRGLQQLSTIHKRLYHTTPTGEIKTVRVPVLDCNTNKPKIDPHGDIIYGYIDEPQYAYQFNTELAAAAANTVLIIDEASMVPAEVWYNLALHWAGAILVCGDQHQLNPVEHDLSKEIAQWENFFADELASQNPPSTIDLGGNAQNKRLKNNNGILPTVIAHIAAASNQAGNALKLSLPEEDYVYHRPPDAFKLSPLSLNMIYSADIVIAHTNIECDYINKLIRQNKYQSQYTILPKVGDRFIAKSHYYSTSSVVSYKIFHDKESGKEKVIPIYEQLIQSGEEYTIVDIIHYDAPNNVIYVMLDGIGGETIPMSVAKQLGGKSPHPIKHINWDYAYCVTGHKAQGSQWDTVCIIATKHHTNEGQKRWMYTAATRAQKTLLVVDSGLPITRRVK